VLTAGDGAAANGEPVLELVVTEAAEVRLFELNGAGAGS
jgi:hypothetical protein